MQAVSDDRRALWLGRTRVDLDALGQAEARLLDALWARIGRVVRIDPADRRALVSLRARLGAAGRLIEDVAGGARLSTRADCWP